MPLPIGALLVKRGVITEDDCKRVLEHQRASGRPFGEIAEDILGVSSRAVEEAWAEQYASETRWVDPTLNHIDPIARDLLTRRQAWQFGLLPMGYEDGQLVMCTTKVCLVRAMNFATRYVPATCYYVLSEPGALSEALMRHYPMDGMGLEILENGGRLAKAG